MKNLKRKAYREYCNGGASSVYDLAVKAGVSYAYCEFCDADVPQVSNECLICGQPVESIRRKK